MQEILPNLQVRTDTNEPPRYPNQIWIDNREKAFRLQYSMTSNFYLLSPQLCSVASAMNCSARIACCVAIGKCIKVTAGTRDRLSLSVKNLL